MGKLETFDKKQTNWEGLWYHREYNGFRAQRYPLQNLVNSKGVYGFTSVRTNSLTGVKTVGRTTISV